MNRGPKQHPDLVNDVNVYVARAEEDRPQENENTEGYKNQGPYHRASFLISSLLKEAGLDSQRAGTETWNPFAELIRPGETVVIKPNWVMHENRSGKGMECLVTQAPILKEVMEFVLRANPQKIIIGDAPIQGCEMPKFLEATGYNALVLQTKRRGLPVEWMDFRAAVNKKRASNGDKPENICSREKNIVFDLAEDSLLEPISSDADRFRVTMYNPDLMKAAHGPGRHQYLVSRAVIEADTVINLPKLKTHKKTGITGALKNVIGINCHKDYLPHHRLGGSLKGGDCYEGRSPLKFAAERLHDRANRSEGWRLRFWRQMAHGSSALARLSGEDHNLEGSWFGNDTIWRTCLDLNRILLYGTREGTLADKPQRRVWTITDAIICGEGEGPLTPIPREMGMMTMADNPVAADYFHAYAMGFDWEKIPLIREAFGRYRFPLCDFLPQDIVFLEKGKTFSQPWEKNRHRPFLAPAGWKGRCERRDSPEG